MKVIFKFGDFLKFEEMAEEQLKPVIYILHPREFHIVSQPDPNDLRVMQRMVTTMTFERKQMLDRDTILYEFMEEH